MNETITYRGWRIEKHVQRGRLRWTVYYPDAIRKITGHKAHDKNSLAEAQTMINRKIAQYGTAKEYVATGEEWEEYTKLAAEKWDETGKQISVEELGIVPEMPQTSMSPLILVAIFIGVLGYLLFGSVRKG